jgi:hypothetical protein
VNVFDCHLKAIKAAGFWQLNFRGKVLRQVFIDNAIGGGKKGQDVRDKVPLIGRQALLPVLQIRGQVNLLRRPKGCLRFLVHFPNLARFHSKQQQAGRTYVSVVELETQEPASRPARTNTTSIHAPTNVTNNVPHCLEWERGRIDEDSR